MDYLVAAAGLLTVGAYIWSLRGHFVSKTMPKGTRVISALVAASTVLYLYLTFALDQPLWAQIAGFAFQLVAGALFAAAIRASRQAQLEYIFTPEKPRGLVETGPYRYMRHPFYSSYILFWSGWALATWSAFAVPSVVLFIVLYVVAARGEEEKFAQTPLAQTYAAYKARTGFLWPRLARG
ncbi:methyltransferase family protein [Pelagibacterium limicola]|uniref:methyltransferase family protein n=1 Tax=Pelagibacterium limicola TaxID=2791022 RepID=UPI0018AF5E41|nr:isoprenylcysteine carboxylmethyltransferase family protein [Pelagibacterium limicola]